MQGIVPGVLLKIRNHQAPNHILTISCSWSYSSYSHSSAFALFSSVLPGLCPSWTLPTPPLQLLSVNFLQREVSDFCSNLFWKTFQFGCQIVPKGCHFTIRLGFIGTPSKVLVYQDFLSSRCVFPRIRSFERLILSSGISFNCCFSAVRQHQNLKRHSWLMDGTINKPCWMFIRLSKAKYWGLVD